MSGDAHVQSKNSQRESTFMHENLPHVHNGNCFGECTRQARVYLNEPDCGPWMNLCSHIPWDHLNHVREQKYPLATTRNQMSPDENSCIQKAPSHKSQRRLGILNSSTGVRPKHEAPIRSRDDEEPNLTRQRLLHPSHRSETLFGIETSRTYTRAGTNP